VAKVTPDRTKMIREETGRGMMRGPEFWGPSGKGQAIKVIWAGKRKGRDTKDRRRMYAKGTTSKRTAKKKNHARRRDCLKVK